MENDLTPTIFILTENSTPLCTWRGASASRLKEFDGGEVIVN